ncbi:DsbA family protein [Nocardiopsis sp. YSL2]|uniref:DsbA family protein n=1 Tax=Nocardiopsis sp. YSL2 TaxID=2939492 RepID=UPI0026F454EB|nr:DsbA family protein [Nocardiopsis sp. YSL2]
MQLVYVFDAYCGWSYGFSGTLKEVTERHPGLPVQVVSGGLFTGERRPSLGRLDFIPSANAKVTELTGAEFGEGFDRLFAEGSFVLDSGLAARGVAALRQAAPERAAELAAALQRAFYVDGRDLGDSETYRVVAEEAGLDADAVVAAFESPEARAAAEADFRRAAELGVSSYPTLIAVEDGRATLLARGHASADEVDARLTALQSS